MRATLVPLLARAAPAVRPSIAARSPSRWVAMSAKGEGKKGGDANDAKDGYGGEASVGKATGGQTSADALTAAALKEAGISVILGSKSFTRKAILKEMGIPYEVAVADIDEKAIGDRTDSPKDLVMAIAVAKADAIVKKMGEELGPDMDGQWPIAKDTMLVTCETSQFPIGWLNAEALSNIANMFVTCDVSNRVISPLNVFLFPKPISFGYPLISVTKLTSQFGIVP